MDGYKSFLIETSPEPFLFHSPLQASQGKYVIRTGFLISLLAVVSGWPFFFFPSSSSSAKIAFMFLLNHFRFTLPHSGCLLGFGRLRTAGCFLTNGTRDHMFQHLSNFEPEV